MKKIAILGDSFVSGEVFGIQRFAYEILREIDKIKPNLDISVVVPEYVKIGIEFRNIRIVKFGNVKNRFLWRQICFPYYGKINNCLIVDMTLGLPFWHCDIVCLHDCTYEKYKNNFKSVSAKLKRVSYLIRAKHLVKSSKKIITVSNYSKEELCNYYEISKEKITVIYNAWQHYERIKQDDSVLNKLKLQKGEYLFSLGSAFPHKNLIWVIQAAIQNPQYKFVITGSDRFSNYLENLNINNIKNIIYTGYLSDEEVKALMSECMAFIHPYFCEGFGIPPLEALSTGAKCIVSSTTCLPEIYEKSVIYIEPTNYSIDIYDLLKRKVDKDEIIKILGKYSWKKSAEIFIESLLSVLREEK